MFIPRLLWLKNADIVPLFDEKHHYTDPQTNDDKNDTGLV